MLGSIDYFEQRTTENQQVPGGAFCERSPSARTQTPRPPPGPPNPQGSTWYQSRPWSLTHGRMDAWHRPRPTLLHVATPPKCPSKGPHPLQSLLCPGEGEGPQSRSVPRSGIHTHDLLLCLFLGSSSGTQEGRGGDPGTQEGTGGGASSPTTPRDPETPRELASRNSNPFPLGSLASICVLAQEQALLPW